MIRITTRVDGDVKHTEDFHTLAAARRSLVETVRVGVTDFAETDDDRAWAARLEAKAADAIPGDVINCPRRAQLVVSVVQA